MLRIFPTRTRATPIDPMARIRETPSLFDYDAGIDEVHISVAFTWDIPWAEWAAKQWENVAPVMIGGPAYNEPGGDFVPGMYMKHGYVITSRGCPNRCWFCAVPKREGGKLREQPVTDGWIVTDDNLLACSQGHIDEVFAMLARQPHRPQFTGGLEAALLTPAMAAQLKALKPESLFFAYDTPNDLDPLVEAGRMLIDVGFTKASNTLRCYVLIGYRGIHSRKHNGVWVKSGRQDSCPSPCSTGTKKANSTKPGGDFKANGPIRRSHTATAKNTLENESHRNI